MSFELDKNSFSRYLGRSLNLLAEFTHPDFDKDYYFINNTQELVLDGKTYEPYPFDVALPSQSEQQGTKMVLSNVNQLVSNQIEKTITSNENILCQLYVANVETDIAEKYDKGLFEVFTPNINIEAVTIVLNLRQSLSYNVGTIRYNKQLFGNLSL